VAPANYSMTAYSPSTSERDIRGLFQNENGHQEKGIDWTDDLSPRKVDAGEKPQYAGIVCELATIRKLSRYVSN